MRVLGYVLSPAPSAGLRWATRGDRPGACRLRGLAGTLVLAFASQPVVAALLLGLFCVFLPREHKVPTSGVGGLFVFTPGEKCIFRF